LFHKLAKILKENTSDFLMYLIKDFIFLISAWQLDIVASGVIAKYYSEVSKWIMHIPIGITNHFPYIIIGWEATSWTFPDAYVRFFFLLSLAFFIPEIYLIGRYLKKVLGGSIRHD